ncbi:MAG: tetratricopeptide repeat protein, partial [Holosporales bacterium]
EYYLKNNFEDAARWYRKAAEQGDASAQFNLGFILARGEGVTKDLKKAVPLIQKEVEKGHGLARYNLGLMYDNGKSVGKELKEAEKWYRKAVDQEHAEAQFNLGLIIRILALLLSMPAPRVP